LKGQTITLQVSAVTPAYVLAASLLEFFMHTSFGLMLKDWRARRRVSQLDLALSANVSARHVAFLETGRARPSRPMVMQLAAALELPLEMRNGLLNAAGFAPSYTRRTLDDASMAHVRSAIDWSLQRHSPYPAFAKDRHWCIVATNDVAAAMLKGAGLAKGDSLLDLVTDETRLLATFANPGEVGRHILQRLRLESNYYGGEAVLEKAAEKLASIDTVKNFLPHTHLPAVVPALYRMGDQVLSLFSTLAQFGTAEDLMLADLQMEFLFPADDDTRDYIEAMQGR
jgi:transcriptional regulator with XRE-family HTH domain